MAALRPDPPEPAGAIPAAPAPPGKRWTVGSLSYGPGALAALMGFLLWGDFAWSMRERSVTATFQIMVHQHGASDFFVGLLTGTLPSLIGMILGPVISCRSDRFRSRWGRRIPFLLASTPFIVLSLAGLAFSPAIGAWLNAASGGGPERLDAWILATFAVCWTGYDVSAVVANAVFGGLINDVVPRPVIGRFFSLFRILSLVAGAIFNFWIIGHAAGSSTAIFLAVGALYGAGFSAMCLRVREGDYPPPEPPAAKDRGIGAVAAYFRDSFADPSHRWIYAVMVLSGVSFAAINAFAIFAADSYGLSNAAYGKYVAVSYGCSLLLAFPIGWLTDRFHPVRTGTVTMALYAAAMAAACIGVRGPVSFGVALVVHTVLSGAFMTATAGLGQVLFPRQRFSQIASACGLCCALATMLGTPALGWVLDRSGHHYRLTFALSAIAGTLAVAAWIALRRSLRARGVDLGQPAA